MSEFDKTKIDSTNLSAVWERIAELIQLITGNVDVINAGTLQTQINNMLNGRTTVGNSEKLGGNDVSYFAPAVGSVFCHESEDSVPTDNFVPVEADTLGGYEVDYFASKEQIDETVNDLKEGDIVVGNSNMLDGKDSEYFETMIGEKIASVPAANINEASKPEFQVSIESLQAEINELRTEVNELRALVNS